VSPPRATLLVVDDDEAYRLALVDHFGARGFAVEAAGSLAEASACLKAGAPDVLLLDQELPDGHGGTFAGELLSRGTATKILLITAYAGLPEAVEALRAGVFDYLSKPVDLAELELKVERALTLADLERARALGESLLGELEAVLSRVRALTRILPAGDPRFSAPREPAPRTAPAPQTLAVVERMHVERTLAAERGNLTAAARRLGISRATLRRKVRDHGLPAPDSTRE
jgi:two-component system response regulator PilR (NtrC family)